MRHEMDIPGETGHTTVKWDPDNEEEIKVAKETFDQMLAKGYIAFYAGPKASGLGRKKRGKMTSFDPKAKRMILCAPMQGG